MKKEEFEKGYIERSGITPELYHKYWVTLPCDCGGNGCEGWAAIPNDPISIEDHNRFYNPEFKK